jgi:hypothetical protein
MAKNTPMHAHQTPDGASEALKLAPVGIHNFEILGGWKIHFNNRITNSEGIYLVLTGCREPRRRRRTAVAAASTTPACILPIHLGEKGCTVHKQALSFHSLRYINQDPELVKLKLIGPIGRLILFMCS